MDSGVAALAGTVVGGLTSVATTWLSEYWRNKRSNKLAEKRKQRLRQLLLLPKYKWRSLEMLSDSIGADQETTIALLLEIDARRSIAPGSDSWGLISRNPYPEETGSD